MDCETRRLSKHEIHVKNSTPRPRLPVIFSLFMSRTHTHKHARAGEGGGRGAFVAAATADADAAPHRTRPTQCRTANAHALPLAHPRSLAKASNAPSSSTETIETFVRLFRSALTHGRLCTDLRS